MPVIDRNILQPLVDLSRECGEDILGSAIRAFLEDAPPRIEALGQDLENPDAKTIERHAHTLKSSAATLGAMGLRDQCRDLEDAASIGNLGGAAERIQAIQDEYATVSRELQAILDGE